MENKGVIIGNGIVGNATANSLNIDKYFDLKGSNTTLTDVDNLYKWVFLCLPTPFEKERYQTDILESYIRQLSSKHVFVIRSTVYPGFGAHMASKYSTMVVSYPEFLTESSALDDSLHPDIVVAGSTHKPALDGLHEFFTSRLGGQHYYLKSNTEAELTKIAINGLYSTKTLFANMMYDYAKTLGADWQTVKEIMYRRKWVGANHLTVPYKGKRGLNGKCLPKDFKALAQYSGNTFLKEWVKYSEQVGGLKE